MKKKKKKRDELQVEGREGKSLLPPGLGVSRLLLPDDGLHAALVRVGARESSLAKALVHRAQAVQQRFGRFGGSNLNSGHIEVIVF